MEIRNNIQSEMERRVFNFEARANSSDGKMTIGGTAAVFNRYTNMGWFAEVIEPGFFDNMDMEQCACLYNHDVNYVLGRKKSGTLTLAIVPDGLDYTSNLPDTRRDVFESVERGDVYQSSFGFTVSEAEWQEMTREQLQGFMSQDDIDALMYAGTVSVRRLKRGKKLYDVSPVTFPAYADTTVAKRGFDLLGVKKEQPQAPDARGKIMDVEIAIRERELLLSAYK